MLTLLMYSGRISSQIKNARYQLIFSDEFNLPDFSRPDTTVWSVPPQNTNVRWRRWISNLPEVAYIKNGKLVLRAIPNKEKGSNSDSMLTGALWSRGKFSFQYGRVEVRMRTNLKQGNSPAVWMGVDTYEPVPYAEIDIVECFDDRGEAEHNVHTHQTITLKKKGTRNHFSEKLKVNRWHIYGLQWTKDSIIWTVDGKNVGTYARSYDPKQIMEGQWTFDKKFFILMNQSLGDGQAGKHPNTKEIYETQIDWVRIYQIE